MQTLLAHIWGVVTGDPHVRKATTALVVTELAGVGAAMADGNLTGAEVVVSTGAALVATAAVWCVPNKAA